MSFRQRHASNLGFAFAALILIAIAALVIKNSLRYIEDNRWVAHTYAVIGQVETIASLEHQTLLSQREFLLTGRYSDRNAYWSGNALLPIRLASLRDAVADNPEQTRLADELSRQIGLRLKLSTHTLELAERDGFAAALANLRQNRHEAADQEIARLVAAMHRNEQRLLDDRRAASEASARWLLGSAAVGVPLSLLILASVYLALIRQSRVRAAAERATQQLNEALEQSAARAQKVSADMSALSNYARMLQGCGDAEESYDVTVQSLSKLLPGLAGTIYIARASRDHADAVAQWGSPAAPSHLLAAPSDCWAMRRNLPHYVNDVHAEVKCAHVELPPPSRPAATACLPLSAQGESLGWICLSGPGPGPLPGVDLALTACEQLSLALANLRLKETLRMQSIRDSLTGLFNRRYLEESLAREVSRAQRRQQPLVVLMFDLDHFKVFNDRHGHGGGDALLTAFGRLLQSHCRPEDIPCRYGGEEFTLILPEASRAIGLERAHSVLRATADLVVEHLGQPLSRVTASIGLATLPENGTSATSLLEAADKALYRAKAEGRNRVLAAESLAADQA